MEAVILAIVFLAVLWWWLRRRSKLSARPAETSIRGRSHASNTVPSHLMRRLDNLTRDRRVSERLIERIEFNNPGRSKRWCAEKAIYDIQRDRRS